MRGLFQIRRIPDRSRDQDIRPTATPANSASRKLAPAISQSCGLRTSPRRCVNHPSSTCQLVRDELAFVQSFPRGTRLNSAGDLPEETRSALLADAELTDFHKRSA